MTVGEFIESLQEEFEDNEKYWLIGFKNGYPIKIWESFCARFVTEESLISIAAGIVHQMENCLELLDGDDYYRQGRRCRELLKTIYDKAKVFGLEVELEDCDFPMIPNHIGV